MLLDRQKEEIESTRSPFGVFSRKETKEAYAHSIRSTEQNADNIRQLLAQVQQVESRMLPLLRTGIDDYLTQVTVDYRQLKQGMHSIDDWISLLGGLPDTLLAFARELRVVRTSGPGTQMVRAIAAARELAQRLEAALVRLTNLADPVNQALQTAGSDRRLPGLPELRRTAWVQRLAVLSTQQAAQDAAGVETATRQFLATGIGCAMSHAQACRDACQTLANRHLDQYQEQLRAYANEHYDFAATDVETALQSLTARYVDTDLLRHQQELTLDPFSINR
jgi:hypothetical protein